MEVSVLDSISESFIVELMLCTVLLFEQIYPDDFYAMALDFHTNAWSFDAVRIVEVVNN